LREQKEHKEFWLQQVKERAFPKYRKWKVLVDDSEDEDGESEDEQGHGKAPCDTCCERELVVSGVGPAKSKPAIGAATSANHVGSTEWGIGRLG
jgi:hypothetical protein